uniref:DUF790 family protein n=1 Tax=Magnetococcus massalia (strain MO-1) TaxID=451514 RepID=A0A1S7LK77_MAGMO|nr:conserved protein of unknown function [Candidatus Magnetococcus massalia]
MLTKEHLRFNLKRGEIKPGFIDVENKALQIAVESLIDIMAHGEGQTRQELSEQLQPIIASGYRSPKIMKGMEKLLLDRCSFHEAEEGVAERRMEIFLHASELLQQADMDDLTQFRTAVSEPHKQQPEELAANLYADLPDRQPLKAFRPITAQKLLYRYNAAQVQGLLLRTDKLTVNIAQSDASTLRPLLRQLRFQQLLALVTRSKQGAVKMVLDGPISLLEQTQKYGMQLALFFPSLLLQAQWALQAEVTMQGRGAATLKLDNSAPLAPWQSITSAYRPTESYQHFAQQFSAKVSDWRLEEEPTIEVLKGQELLAPDYTFTHLESGKVVHLELFHRWHAGPLERRLPYLERAKGRLIIGVDRGLSRRKDVVAFLAESTGFERFGFLFNDLPPVKRVEATLNQTLGR